MRVSTSVAKLMLLASEGSELERLHSIGYDASSKMGLDCMGEAPSDLTMGRSAMNALRVSRTVESGWTSGAVA